MSYNNYGSNIYTSLLALTNAPTHFYVIVIIWLVELKLLLLRISLARTLRINDARKNTQDAMNAVLVFPCVHIYIYIYRRLEKHMDFTIDQNFPLA